MEIINIVRESFIKFIKEFRVTIGDVIANAKDKIKSYAGGLSSSLPLRGFKNNQSNSKTSKPAEDDKPKSSPRPVKMRIVDGGRVIGFDNPNYINSQFVGQKKGKKKGKSRKKAEDEQTVNKKIKRR